MFPVGRLMDPQICPHLNTSNYDYVAIYGKRDFEVKDIEMVRSCWWAQSFESLKSENLFWLDPREMHCSQEDGSLRRTDIHCCFYGVEDYVPGPLRAKCSPIANIQQGNRNLSLLAAWN